MPSQPHDTWGKCLFGFPPRLEYADSEELFWARVPSHQQAWPLWPEVCLGLSAFPAQLVEPPASSQGQLSGEGLREPLAGLTLRSPATAPPPSSFRQEQARESSRDSGQRPALLIAGRGFHGDSWDVMDPTKLPL